eukprot:3732187-Rhodomonas_salina.1
MSGGGRGVQDSQPGGGESLSGFGGKTGEMGGEVGLGERGKWGTEKECCPAEVCSREKHSALISSDQADWSHWHFAPEHWSSHFTQTPNPQVSPNPSRPTGWPSRLF